MLRVNPLALLSLRTRLTLWSAGVLALTVAAFCLLVYLTVHDALLATVDASLADRAQRTSLYIIVAERPPYFVTDNLQQTLDNFTSADWSLQVTGVDGQVLARSTTWRLGALGGTGRPGPARPQSLSAAGGSVRVYVAPLYAHGTLIGFLSVAGLLAATQQVLNALSRGLLAVGALALALTAAVVLALAHRALQPVAAITRTAQAITASGQLTQRVPYQGPPDEIGQLAATFNAMLIRLDELQAAQKRFVADASHELRTPLTSILGSAEWLARAPDVAPAEQAETMADIIAESRRLARLVEGLLSLARADGGQKLAIEEVWLDQVAREMVARVMAAHPRSAISLRIRQPVPVPGDPDRLRELLMILLDNAAKYAPPASPITCTVDEVDGRAWLQVQDRGIGISPADLPHIFERFYRSPRARRHDHQGAGLGLSIAAWIVQQHEGHIEVCSTEGTGTTITVSLPLHALCPPPTLPTTRGGSA